jgi:hypothetical protein
MCNKSIICGVLFVSGAITSYESNDMLSDKEDYDHLKLACKPIFLENKHIIRKSKYWSWGETFWFRYFDGWWYELFATCAWVGWVWNSTNFPEI